MLLRSCDGAKGDHRDREGACIPVEQVDDVAVRRCHLLQQARGDLLSPRSQRRAARREHLLHPEPRTMAVTEGERPGEGGSLMLTRTMNRRLSRPMARTGSECTDHTALPRAVLIRRVRAVGWRAWLRSSA